MPNSILMYPDAGTLVGEDLFYLVKGAGGADRDRHVTLEAIRRFCTSKGVEFKEVSLALSSAPAITDVDITSTSNVVLVVWGRFPNPTDNRLNVHGTIPEGCTVTIISGHLGIIDLRVNGAAPTNTPADLDFGTFGHAVLTSRDGQFLTSVFNDSRWNKNTIDTAISTAVGEEVTRATTAEADLSNRIVRASQVRHASAAGFPTYTQSSWHDILTLDLGSESGVTWEVELYILVAGVDNDVVPFDYSVKLAMGGSDVDAWAFQRSQFRDTYEGTLHDPEPVSKTELTFPKSYVTTPEGGGVLTLSCYAVVGSGGGAQYGVKPHITARRLDQ
jgi:hypothetical protein